MAHPPLDRFTPGSRVCARNLAISIERRQSRILEHQHSSSLVSAHIDCRMGGCLAGKREENNHRFSRTITHEVVTTVMNSEDVRAPASGSGEPTDRITLTQPQMLIGSSAKRGALFAEWGRPKRRITLQERYGEELGRGADDDPLDAQSWFDRP